MLVKYAKLNVLYFNAELRLNPGVNQLSDDQWKEMQKHPKVKTLVLAGDIAVVADRKKAASELPLEPESEELEAALEPEFTGEDNDALSKLPAAKAAKLVKETTDLNLLRSWAAVESRSSVANAIETQIAKLEA